MRNAPYRLADERHRFGYVALTIHSPPCDTTKSTLSTTTQAEETQTYSLPEMKFANGNSINTGHYVILFLGLVGYHLSGLFCDFREAFEHAHEVRPKKPRDFFGVLLVILIFTMQVLLQDYLLQVDEHASFLDYSNHKLVLAILRLWTRATAFAEEEGLLVAHHLFVLSSHHQTQQETYGP